MTAEAEMSTFAFAIEAAKVKIFCGAIGKFSNESWKRVKGNLLKTCKVFNLSAVSSLDDTLETSDSFKRILSKEGRFALNFVTAIDPIASDFFDFQLHHRIFGYLAFIDMDSATAEEVSRAAELVEKFKTDHWPFPVPSRIMAVGGGKETKVPDCFVEILEDEDFDAAFMAAISEFASEIAVSMYSLIQEISKRPSIASPCGIEEFSSSGTGSVPRSPTKGKMRISSRAQKLIGDLYVLIGAYSEALASYVAASEDAKSASDLIWNTAAQEGFNIALILQNESFPGFDAIESGRVLIEKLTPLFASYEKAGVPILSIDLRLTCSRVSSVLNQRPQSISILSEAWKTCSLLSFEERVASCKRILKDFLALKSYRKWAFYLGQLAVILRQAHYTDLALNALNKSLPIYNISSSNSDSDGWTFAQISILKEMVRLSELHPNRLLFFLYSWMYLIYSSSLGESEDQTLILRNLKKYASRDRFTLRSAGISGDFLNFLPLLHKIELKSAGNEVIATTERSSLSKSSGPFIYSPSTAGSLVTDSIDDMSSFLIVNEPKTFTILLNNPFVFPLNLENVHLSINDGGCLCESTSVTLPPSTQNHPVSLRLTPKASGTVSVFGCKFTLMNLQFEVLIDSSGFKTVSPKSGMQFEVIESQPLLRPAFETSSAYLQLFEGEHLCSNLLFKNVGSNPISSFTCKVFIQTDSGFADNVKSEINQAIFGKEKESLIQLSEDEVCRQLPANVSEFIQVPLNICASNFDFAATLEISYSGQVDTLAFWRQLVIPLKITVISSLCIDDCAFFPYSQHNSLIIPKLEAGNDPEDWAIGSFLAKNTSSFTARTSFRTAGIENIEEHIIPPFSCRKIFFLVPRIKDASVNLSDKLPLGEKQIAAVRKLRNPDLKDFLDDDNYDDVVMDAQLYWTKVNLEKSVELNWNFEDATKRCGKIPWTQIEVLKAFFPILWKSNEIITATPTRFDNVALGDELVVKFSLNPTHGHPKDYQLNIFPVVNMGDDRIDLDYKEVLKYSGCLSPLLLGASASNPKHVEIAFFPVSTASSQIIFQVTELENGQMSWCKQSVSVNVKL